ncbi:MAG: GAF domain-containing protein [Herpetosiphon sp.]
MMQHEEHRLLALLEPDEREIVGDLLTPHETNSWRAKCFSLGYLWFEKKRPAEALTRFGFDLATSIHQEQVPVVTELLLGYASAREDRHSRVWNDRWRQRVAELDGLHRIISAANSTVSLDASLKTMVDTVSDVMGCEVCSIFLWERDRNQLCLRATRGLNRGAIGLVNIPLGEGITGIAGQQGRPIAVADVRGDPRVFVDQRLEELEYRSILCVPIILFASAQSEVGGDRLQGVISVQTIEPRAWAEEEISFLEVVAGELAFFVANAQRYRETDERLHQKIRELNTLQQVSAAIARTLDLQTVLNLIVNQAVILSSVDRADIYQVDDGQQHLQLMASCGGAWDERLRPVIMRAVNDGHPVAVVNAYDDVRFPELAGVAHGAGYHSLFCIPLRVGSRIMGVIALYSRQQRYFDYEQVQLLSTFADEAAIAIENARLYREAQRSLQIKSTLLQEMHHRVRNNLQTISALLQMQRRRLDPDSPGAVSLHQSASRIQAIAAVHNLLCREDVGLTTVQEVAAQVVDILRNGLENDKPVQFTVVGTPVPISSREATIVALVINELIDNALSHGLAVEGGKVEIAGWIEDQQAILEVRDDGPLHPEAPAKPSSGLGLSIIETLVGVDLEGVFTFNQDEEWVRARVTFPSFRAVLPLTAESVAP